MFFFSSSTLEKYIPDIKLAVANPFCMWFIPCCVVCISAVIIPLTVSIIPVVASKGATMYPVGRTRLIIGPYVCALVFSLFGMLSAVLITARNASDGLLFCMYCTA